ncbi:MAG: hypothetical protein Q8P89_03795 [bacterium]|nr:hypothetical protein [bacterium]
MTERKIKKSSLNINPWMVVSFILLAVFALKTLFEADINIKPKFLSQGSKVATTQPQPTGQAGQSASTGQVDLTKLEKDILPAEGVELPIVWGDLGKQLITKGVIDQAKFETLFAQRGGLKDDEKNLLSGLGNQSIRMTQQNANFLLDLFWAFGLANKNDVLDKGEMMRDPKQVGNFASTGGWTLAKSQATDYYSKFSLVKLTPEQQALVEKVSQGIYRPCCGNSTHFPDCNHGMAMLGLLELMAANGVSETDMYKKALVVNSFWFPQTYVELAAYFQEQGKNWNQVDPKEVLGKNYSSAQGYQKTRSQIKSLPQPQQGGGGCGA